MSKVTIYRPAIIITVWFIWNTYLKHFQAHIPLPSRITLSTTPSPQAHWHVHTHIHTHTDTSTHGAYNMYNGRHFGTVSKEVNDRPQSRWQLVQQPLTYPIMTCAHYHYRVYLNIHEAYHFAQNLSFSLRIQSSLQATLAIRLVVTGWSQLLFTFCDFMSASRTVRIGWPPSSYITTALPPAKFDECMNRPAQREYYVSKVQLLFLK